MKGKLLPFVIISISLLISACSETSDSEKYYLVGIKAEQKMQYEKAIESYAKSLQFDREDAISWFAKGRCHLLLLMETALTDSISAARDIKIMGNLNKATECFKRSAQWGFRSTPEVDSLQVRLRRRFLE